MTLVNLQKSLVAEIGTMFANQKFIKYREMINEEIQRIPINVYSQSLPRSLKNDPDLYTPYIIVRVEKGLRESMASQSIVDVTFSIKIFDDEDENRGHEDLLNIIDKIEQELAKKRIIANKYIMQYPFYSMLADEDWHPFFIGAIFTRWSLPNIIPECQNA